MAKDRHSNDHTIEMVGDTKTLFVKDNLDVEAGIDAETLDVTTIDVDTINSNTINNTGTITTDTLIVTNLETDLGLDFNTIEGDTTINGDLTVDGDLVVNGTVTGSDFIFSTEKKFIRHVPLYEIYGHFNATETQASVTFGTAVQFPQWAAVTVSPTGSAWTAWMDISPYLINEATFDRIEMTVWTTAVHSFSIEIQQSSKIGTVNNWTSLEIEPNDINSVSNSNIIQQITFQFDDGDIVDTDANIYRIKLSSGVNASFEIHNFEVHCTTDSLLVALNQR